MDPEREKQAALETGSDADEMVLDPRAQVKARDMQALKDDESLFGVWLRGQRHRADAVGAFARMAAQDPFWPGGEKLDVILKHLTAQGAREFLTMTVRSAWAEHQRTRTKTNKRNQRRAKARAAKQARKQRR